MRRILFFASFCLLILQAHAELHFKNGDRILLYGNSFVERLQEDGRLEASLQLANPDKKLEFRSLAWTGDEVGYRLRPERYVNHLKKLLAEWSANFLVLEFGMNESFGGDTGLNQIESKYVPGRGARGYAPVYLFNPLGNAFEDLEVSEDEASLKAMAKTYDKENGMSEGEIRILAVPNQLAFSPSEVRARAGQKLKVVFDNPDHQIHNLVLVRPGAENEVGLLADQMLQDPDAYAKGFVPDTAKVI